MYLCQVALVEEFEPVHEKINNLGFRPGLTQTRLYSHRSRLEAWKFGFKKKRKCTIRVAKTKALISFAVTAKLICVFVIAYANCWFSHAQAHLIVQLTVYVHDDLGDEFSGVIEKHCLWFPWRSSWFDISDLWPDINAYMTQSIFPSVSFGRVHFRFEGHREWFWIFIPFFDAIPVSKENRPRWDAAFCGVSSGAILFA